jgi:predicted NBD/HSP70 family sugar kinase
MIDISCYHDDTSLQKKTLRTIYERKLVSRAELTEILGLSLTSITKHVNALLADGIIAECGTLGSTGGRKTNLLGINPEYAYILGVDIGGYVVRMDGSLVEDWFIKNPQVCMPVGNLGPDGLQDKISQIFSLYDKNRFLAVCVGISGLVNHETGKVIFCPNLAGWNDVNLAERLQNAFGLPVFVDTSARCMALAEQLYGAGAGVADQILVSLGNDGIASALILNSRLYRGGSGFAGEIGHVMCSSTGARCTCGNYDCLELSATLMMIRSIIAGDARKLQAYSPLLQLLPADWNYDALTPEIIRQALEAGDKLCFETVMTAGRHAGIALSNLLNVINPSLVVLGGSVVEFFPSILETIRSTIRERVLVPIGQNLDVRPARLDWRGAVIGSAVMAHEELFR